MNLLAHSFLSGSSTKILIGNFIADFIRGNQYTHLEEEIVRGIYLHRKIDQFTDEHPAVRQSTLRLRPEYGKYAPVLVDVFYDHFLSLHFEIFSDTPLEAHAQHTYRVLLDNQSVLPEIVQNFLPRMVAQNWLARYGEWDGLQKSLQGINHRARFANHLDQSIQSLRADYEAYNQDFLAFFPEIVQFVAQDLSEDDSGGMAQV
ncbi:MAG: acyl carrier protein phosphodiesterase [Microscillaceae bacterium]